MCGTLRGNADAGCFNPRTSLGTRPEGWVTTSTAWAGSGQSVTSFLLFLNYFWAAVPLSLKSQRFAIVFQKISVLFYVTSTLENGNVFLANFWSRRWRERLLCWNSASPCCCSTVLSVGCGEELWAAQVDGGLDVQPGSCFEVTHPGRGLTSGWTWGGAASALGCSERWCWDPSAQAPFPSMWVWGLPS